MNGNYPVECTLSFSAKVTLDIENLSDDEKRTCEAWLLECEARINHGIREQFNAHFGREGNNGKPH